MGAGIWGVSGEDHTTRNDSGSIVEAGQLGAFATQLGDCFESLPDTQGISTVPGVPCTSAHHWQVVYKGTLTLASFEEVAVQNAATAMCNSELTQIANTIPYDKAVEYQNAAISGLFPTSQSWDKGDRSVDCLVGSDTESFFDSLI